MGFLSDTTVLGFMKGKKSKSKMLPAITDPTALKFQSELYPAIESGLSGQGLTPQLTARSIRDTLADLDTSRGETQKDTESMLWRSAQRADTDVKGAVRTKQTGDYARTKQDIGKFFEMQDFTDIGTSRDMASNALGSETRVGTQLTGIANESALRRSSSPTFLSEFSGGMGGMMGILAAGKMPQAPPLNPATPGSSWWSKISKPFDYTNQTAAYSTPAMQYARGMGTKMKGLF